MGPREWSFGGLEGSGAYIIYKIDLPVQSVSVFIIIIFFPGLCCFFPFRLLTLYLHFISKFLYLMCPMPLLNIVHGHYKCS